MFKTNIINAILHRRIAANAFRDIPRWFRTGKVDDFTAIASGVENIIAPPDKSGIKHNRLGSRVKSFISQQLETGPLRDTLIEKCGMSIIEVRMSPDLRTIYILWSARSQNLETAEKILRGNTARLRSLLFRHLKMPFSPELKFKSFSGKYAETQVALENAFQQIKNERGD